MAGVIEQPDIGKLNIKKKGEGKVLTPNEPKHFKKIKLKKNVLRFYEV
jgi:hypothetical protein